MNCIVIIFVITVKNLYIQTLKKAHLTLQMMQIKANGLQTTEKEKQGRIKRIRDSERENNNDIFKD